MLFLESQEGQFAATAKSFMEAALALHEAQASKGHILFRPTLMVIGHGLELMLKACMLLNGGSLERGAHGHDIMSMWEKDICEPVRGHVYFNAGMVCLGQKEIGVYPDVPDPDEGQRLIEEYIPALAELHGSDSRYALRYPGNPKQEAPRTALLAHTLWRTADDFVKRPSDFELDRFRGLR